LLGLVNVWLIVEPELAEAPVMLPTLVPIVQVKVLAMVAVSPMLDPVPLQVLAVLAFVTAGAGITFTVISVTGPTQEPVTEVGVT
jgi:hypothetical protein